MSIADRYFIFILFACLMAMFVPYDIVWITVWMFIAMFCIAGFLVTDSDK